MSKSIKSMIAKLEKIRTQLGVKRDELRELQSEVETLEAATTQGLESLQIAIDELSQQA